MTVLGGVQHRMVSCMHCYKRITQLATGYWVDTDGFYYCMKVTGELATATTRALRHKPLPVIR